ncbi:hypothetical protein C8J56DRAFT_942691 [Mycena floridula]|nr:hypothetical protein C8J56DRAFT_942691 [Mycena floridula]
MTTEVPVTGKTGPPLDDFNYRGWAYRFRAQARAKGYEDIITGKEEEPTTGHNSKLWKSWSQRNKVASADIIAAVTDGQHIHLRSHEDSAYDMWASLKLYHESGSVSSDVMSVWNEFYTASYTDFRIPLKTHLGTIAEIAGRLADIFSDPPSDEQIIARMLSSLPIPEFNDIRCTLLDHSQGKDRVFVTRRLLQEEMSLRLSGKLTYQAPHALHTTMTNNPSTSSTLPQPRCSNCSQGHLLEACFQPGGPLEGNPPAWYAALLARRAAAAAAPVPQANLAYVRTIAM